METATQWLQVVGLAAILTLTTFVFARGVTLTIRGKHHAVRFGVELLVVFTILYYSFSHVLRWTGFDEFIEPVEKTIAFLWCADFSMKHCASLFRIHFRIFHRS